MSEAREVAIYSSRVLHQSGKRRHCLVDVAPDGTETLVAKSVTNPIHSALYRRHPQLTRKQRRELERQAARNLRKRLKKTQ